MTSSTDRRFGLAGFVLGAVALFISLGGDALATRAFQSLRNNTVTSKKVVNGSLKLADLRPAVRAKINAPGPQGPQGPQGPKGEQGPAGPGGSGGAVGDGEITTAKLANNAVTTPKIANNAVGQPKIADNGVAASEIAEGAVGSSEIASNGVGQVELADNAVGIAELANNAVGAAEMADNAIDSNEVADGSLNALDVGEGAGTVSLDFPLIAQGACADRTFDASVPVDGDAVLVTAAGGFAPGFYVTAKAGFGTQVIVTACNNFVADGDPQPKNFAYVVFDV